MRPHNSQGIVFDIPASQGINWNSALNRLGLPDKIQDQQLSLFPIYSEYFLTCDFLKYCILKTKKYSKVTLCSSETQM